jgi:uncharacterized protein (DUF433 family)
MKRRRLVMKLPDFLTLGTIGEIRVTGHRIDLYLLVQKYNEGHTAEMLHCEYPTLPLALIHKVIDFYLVNRVDVDEYVAAVESGIDKLRTNYRPGPGMLRLRDIVKERASSSEKN